MPLTSVVSPTTSGADFLQSTHPTRATILEVYAAMGAGARATAKLLSIAAGDGPRRAATAGQPGRSRRRTFSSRLSWEGRWLTRIRSVAEKPNVFPSSSTGPLSHR
jgi:hypothetical protein